METTFAWFLDEPATPTKQPTQPPKRPKTLRGFQPDQDIHLWLRSNAPRNWQELKDLRYCLYHRCSRADFRVKKKEDAYLTLTGRASSVIIVSNNARRYLLWQLRMLAWEREWVGSGKARVAQLFG
jgi:hypothetical protein